MNSNNMTGQWFGRSLSSESKITTMIVVNIEPRSPSNALLIGLESQYQRRTISDATIEMNGDNIVGKTFNFRVYDHASHSTIPIAAFYNQNGIKEQPPAESEYVGKFDGTKIAGTFKNNLNQTGTFELWRSFLDAVK